MFSGSTQRGLRRAPNLSLIKKRGSPRAIPSTSLRGLGDTAPGRSSGAKLLAPTLCVNFKKKIIKPKKYRRDRREYDADRKRKSEISKCGGPQKKKREKEKRQRQDKGSKEKLQGKKKAG